MRKIGVITYFYYNNYGTMLQGYATQYILNKLGRGKYSTEIIDCRFGEKKISMSQLILIRLRRFFIYFTQLKRIVTIAKYQKHISLKQEKFDSFAKHFCNLTKETYWASSDLDEKPPLFDIYFTGSDQTWSPKVGLRDSLFLGFAPSGKVLASYAPSIGVASFSQQDKQFIKERLARYDFVSCREKYGTDELKSLSPVPVETVLDPTLLLTAEEWRNISIQPKAKEKYILCYFIGDRNYYRSFAMQLSKQLSLPIIYIPVSYLDFSFDNNRLWDTGPREFLGLIDNAEVVLTDSFHGSIFSINFNKTFYSFTKHVGLDSMDNLRIVDILQRMGLSNRLIMEYDGGEIAFSTIDYGDTNQRLAEERSISEKYINKVLDSAK